MSTATDPQAVADNRFISVRGARLHNLCNVDADFPVGAISVVCGPSGCGKSTLVLDVLHAESRRRYLETLSPAALQLLGGPRHIPVDAVHGLRPSIALESNGEFPPKANVASLAEIAPVLRTLWAALSTPVCPECSRPMRSHRHGEILNTLSSLPSGTRLQVYAPVETAGRTLEDLARTYLSQGYTRSLVDNKQLGLDNYPAQDAGMVPQTFAIVVDRIVIRDNQRTRLSEAIDAALRVAGDQFEIDQDGARHFYSMVPRCPEHRHKAPTLTKAHFSPWSPKGQCPQCQGAGLDEQGHACSRCEGLGLRAESLKCIWQGVSWAELHQITLDSLEVQLPSLLEAVPPHLRSTVRDLPLRVQALRTLGLGYLTLGRPAETLSSGEVQRLRLTGLATGHLDGVLLCLDEPASGLHAHDVEKLWTLLEQLRARGNTLVLIEHNPLMIARADWIVEMGPAAGEQGGRILYQGPAAPFLAQTQSSTAAWLHDLKALPSLYHKKCQQDNCITLDNVHVHNLKHISCVFPVQAFTTVCGLSGSGKSSLIWNALAPAVSAHLNGSQAPAECGVLRMQGIENLAGIEAGTFGNQRRSTIATATGLMTPLRELFAKTPESKLRGYTANRFSTTSPGGRCEHCKGEGVLRDPGGYEETECPVCQGSRYRDDTLEIRFKTFSIAEILNLTITRSLELFVNFPAFLGRLSPLADTGLGYLRLGQPTSHLSGGERQRLRLSLELAKANRPRTLYLFDEPARGLHRVDIVRLVELFRGLVEQGHTVVAIEHQPDFLHAADHLIELGPGAGEQGGEIIA